MAFSTGGRPRAASISRKASASKRAVRTARSQTARSLSTTRVMPVARRVRGAQRRRGRSTALRMVMRHGLTVFAGWQNCVDGSNPQAGVVPDGNNNLLGTTRLGGRFGQGTVFAISSVTHEERPLYSFCRLTDCADGKNPVSSVLLVGGDDLRHDPERRKVRRRHDLQDRLGGARDRAVFLLPPVGLCGRISAAGGACHRRQWPSVRDRIGGRTLRRRRRIRTRPLERALTRPD